MSSTIDGIRIVDMPDLGAFNSTSSLVGERAGSGRFSASGLSSYLSTVYLPLAGGTLTGPLTLAGDPTTALQAATKQYADTRVLKAGDTMSGFLTLNADPMTALQAATKQYADTRVLKAGDTMSGFLTLNADPMTALQAATKQYVDTKLTQATADALYVNIAGDTMTGQLTLAADPATPLQAATKAYVDTRLAIVADIGTLRALTVVPGNAVWVQGYHASEDGGEGMFQYNPGDSTTADNGGTFIVDAAGHRWRREGYVAGVTVKQFGAVSDGAGDQTGSFQAAINAVAAAGGGIVRVTPGNYRLTGTLSIAASNVRLVGDSMYGCILTFANGATADCIRVGFQASAINDVVVSTLSIVGGAGKTGGSGIDASRVAYCQFNNLNISGVPNGIAVAILNNVWIYQCQVICSTAGFACINWTSPANATDQSDVLTIIDTVVNAQGNGQIGLHLDGNCQTLRVNRLGIIHCKYGMLVENSAASNQYFPQFVYCDDMEIDGVDLIGLFIKAGRQMHFVNTTMFNAGGAGTNTNALFIASDGSASVTNYVTFTNCAFAGANHEGVICYARQVDFNNCYIGDNSVSGVGSYDAMALGNDGTVQGPATSVTVTGGRIGSVFGDLQNERYGVSVGTGCSKITVTGVDFTNCVTRAISDGSGGFGNVMWHGCVGINGVPLPDRLQQLSADPTGADLIEGMMWQNVTTFALKCCLNGVVKTVTVT